MTEKSTTLKRRYSLFLEVILFFIGIVLLNKKALCHQELPLEDSVSGLEPHGVFTGIPPSLESYSYSKEH